MVQKNLFYSLIVPKENGVQDSQIMSIQFSCFLVERAFGPAPLSKASRYTQRHIQRAKRAIPLGGKKRPRREGTIHSPTLFPSFVLRFSIFVLFYHTELYRGQFIHYPDPKPRSISQICFYFQSSLFAERQSIALKYLISLLRKMGFPISDLLRMIMFFFSQRSQLPGCYLHVGQDIFL